MNMTDCWCCAYCVKFSVAVNVIINQAVILIVSVSALILILILILIVILILVKLEVSNLNL